jgi:hypothetical protein
MAMHLCNSDPPPLLSIGTRQQHDLVTSVKVVSHIITRTRKAPPDPVTRTQQPYLQVGLVALLQLVQLH